MSSVDRILSPPKGHPNPVVVRRQARQWSQAELARRAGISRAGVSAIEGQRLVPSVATALTLAEVLECSVEDLFGRAAVSSARTLEWAWTPPGDQRRYWEAEVNGGRLRYPVEALSLNPVPHDGVLDRGIDRETAPSMAERTLTLACCDPAASLLAAEYARRSGFRLLTFPRGGSRALELLKQGRVHLAGLHRSTSAQPQRNADWVRAALGKGYWLLRAAQWEAGLVLPPGNTTRSAATVVKESRRWAVREPGSGAREVLDELLAGRRVSGRQTTTHAGVAEAVRAGWAQAGVCVRLCAAEAGLSFLPLHQETLDFCFADDLRSDPRLQALVSLFQDRSYRRVVDDLPGYATRETGQLVGA